MKIVVAMDSMKGCLSSGDASGALADGIRSVAPGAEVAAVAVADGGEGTAAALAAAKSEARMLRSRVKGPDGGCVEAEWCLDPSDDTACIDMAAAAGLTLLPEERRNPMHTTTYGVGQLIVAAAARGAGKVILGLGGSATVDGGLGACQALGVRFYRRGHGSRMSRLITEPVTGNVLSEIDDIDADGVGPGVKNMRILLACDVDAPFTGPSGAACVFGPQKGASPEEVSLLDRGLENVRNIIKRKYGLDLNEVAGSGAAGGCAGGMVALLGAKIGNGAAIVLDSVGFDKVIEGADLVLTGEGKSDRQTLMGKLPFEILKRGQRHGVPVCLVAGIIDDAMELREAGYADIIDINSGRIAMLSATEGANPMSAATAAKRLFFAGSDVFSNFARNFI